MRFLRIALTIAILSFVCSAIYISALMFQRQTALDSVGLGDVTWTVAQAPSEFSRLEQRVSALGMADSRVGADEVRLRFDIVTNRLKTLRSRDAATFVLSDARIGRILDDLEQALNDSRPLLADLAVPGTAARMLDILEPIYPKLVRLSTDANVWNIARHRRRAAGPLQPAMGLHAGRHRHDCLRRGPDHPLAAAEWPVEPRTESAAG